MSKGWILLHKKMLSWEWYTDVNTCKLFLHLLLKANYEPKTWQGESLRRGELISSRESLAVETGLTLQQTRTAEDKLKSTNDIAITSTNKFTRYFIVNYDEYQLDPSEATNEITIKATNETTGRATNQKGGLATTANKEKETNKIIKEEKKVSVATHVEKMIFDFMPLDWKAWLITEKGWDEEIMNDEWTMFRNYWQTGKGKAEKRPEWFTTFKIWMRKQNPKPAQGNSFAGRLSFQEQKDLKHKQVIEEARLIYAKNNPE